ncbi:MAG: PorT family protein [Flavobacteriales bacterium]|nr:PorT family protein [Flavobacteriales bacterium]
MKQRILVLGLLILTSASFHAQSGEFHVGARYAMGVSDIVSDGLDETTGKLAFNAGFAGLYELSNSLALGVDILGSWKGAKESGDEYAGDDVFGNPVYRDYKGKYKFIDLEVPLMASYRFLEGNFQIGVLAGVATNFNLVALQSRTYDNENYNEDNGFENAKLNNMEAAHFSHVLGLGFHVGSEDEQRFFFEVRNIGGLSDFGTIDSQGAQHNRIELGIGYYL